MELTQEEILFAKRQYKNDLKKQEIEQKISEKWQAVKDFEKSVRDETFWERRVALKKQYNAEIETLKGQLE